MSWCLHFTYLLKLFSFFRGNEKAFLAAFKSQVHPELVNIFKFSLVLRATVPPNVFLYIDGHAFA